LDKFERWLEREIEYAEKQIRANPLSIWWETVREVLVMVWRKYARIVYGADAEERKDPWDLNDPRR
jgi:hypothetical protein